MPILQAPSMMINGRKVHFIGKLPPWYVDQKSEEEFNKRKETVVRGFSENAAKCVLRNINFYKRQGVSTVSPNHAKLNYQTPYRLTQLEFAAKTIWIDDASFAPIQPIESPFAKLTDLLNPDLVHATEFLYVQDLADIRKLPKTLKFRVNRLKLHNDTKDCFKAIRSNIHTSSFPLKAVEIAVDHPGDPVFNNFITGEDCKMLSLKLPPGLLGMGFWSEPLSRLNHPNVVVFGSQEFAVSNLTLLARQWMLHPRPIGQKFGVITKEVQMYLDGLAAKPELKASRGVMANESPCVTIPIDHESEIVIYGNINPFLEKMILNKDATIWMVSMDVRAKESVIPVKEVA